MKNKLNLLLVLGVMIFVIGCSCGNISSFIPQEESKPTSTQKDSPNAGSNDSIVDKTIENIADGETTGVQECDDFIKMINEASKTQDDNWVTKGARDYVIGQIKKSLRESIEKNKGDKKQMAEQCKSLRQSFEKSLAEEKNKPQ